MPDLILLTVDSLRPDHLSCYGYHRKTSPNIDKLADSGCLFTNAFSAGNATRSSFPSIMTSTYPMMYGGYEVITKERTMVSEVLQESGYVTGGFHSNPYLSADFGYSRGFDQYHDWRDKPSTAAKIRQYVKNNLDNDGILFRTIKKAFNKTEERTGVEVGSLYTDAREITDKALSWLEEHQDRETFLWVHYMDVHHPYNPPAEHQVEFRDEVINAREAKRLRRRMLESPDDLTTEERQILIDLYDAEIAYVDSQISRIISSVDNGTDIIFTSDHGEEFGEHGRYSHHETFFDENIHIPLIIKSNSRKEVYDHLISSLDIAPTLLDLANLKNPDSYLGQSLSDLNSYELHDWVMSSVDGRFMCRSNRWKYITENNGPQLLFDLDTDSAETDNVDDQYPAVIEKCENKLEELQDMIQSTSTRELTHDIDAETKERLRQLGYRE